MLTPLPWRRPWKVASQVVTLDQLSGGRAILAVGLGATDVEIGVTGEEEDLRVRPAQLDEALDLITGVWAGRAVFHGEHYDMDLSGRGDLTTQVSPSSSPGPDLGRRPLEPPQVDAPGDPIRRHRPPGGRDPRGLPGDGHMAAGPGRPRPVRPDRRGRGPAGRQGPGVGRRRRQLVAGGRLVAPTWPTLRTPHRGRPPDGTFLAPDRPVRTGRWGARTDGSVPGGPEDVRPSGPWYQPDAAWVPPSTWIVWPVT